MANENSHSLSKLPCCCSNIGHPRSGPSKLRLHLKDQHGGSQNRTEQNTEEKGKTLNITLISLIHAGGISLAKKTPILFPIPYISVYISPITTEKQSP